VGARLLVALALGAAAVGATSPAAAEPTWWISTGGQAAIELGQLDRTLDTEGSGWLAAGWHLLRLGPVLLGPEVEGTAGKVSANLGLVGDDVTVLRGRVGVRAIWWEEDAEPLLVPYLRSGAVYRYDTGKFIEDDGIGFYVGIGLDVRLSEHWSVGPFLTYERVSLSVQTETLLVGVGLTFSWGD